MSTRKINGGLHSAVRVIAILASDRFDRTIDLAAGLFLLDAAAVTVPSRAVWKLADYRYVYIDW